MFAFHNIFKFLKCVKRAVTLYELVLPTPNYLYDVHRSLTQPNLINSFFILSKVALAIMIFPSSIEMGGSIVSKTFLIFSSVLYNL